MYPKSFRRHATAILVVAADDVIQILHAIRVISTAELFNNVLPTGSTWPSITKPQSGRIGRPRSNPWRLLAVAHLPSPDCRAFPESERNNREDVFAAIRRKYSLTTCLHIPGKRQIYAQRPAPIETALDDFPCVTSRQRSRLRQSACGFPIGC